MLKFFPKIAKKRKITRFLKIGRKIAVDELLVHTFVQMVLAVFLLIILRLYCHFYDLSVSTSGPQLPSR